MKKIKRYVPFFEKEYLLENFNPKNYEEFKKFFIEKLSKRYINTGWKSVDVKPSNKNVFNMKNDKDRHESSFSLYGTDFNDKKKKLQHFTFLVVPGSNLFRAVLPTNAIFEARGNELHKMDSDFKDWVRQNSRDL
jgi:hypothetical protein